jgi:hypothetical protein
MKKLLDGAAHVYFLALITLLLTQGLVDDRLLFTSDAVSYAVFTLSLSIPLFLCLAIAAGLVAALWPSGRAQLLRWIPRLAAALILVAVVIYAFEAFVSTITATHWLIAALACGIPAALVLVLRLDRSGQITFRIGRLAKFAAIASPVTLTALGIDNALSNGASRRAPASAKHAVLIVIDGYPVEFLRSYNPTRPVTGFDKLAEERGLLFTNFRTNTIWTNGFFGALYTGRMKRAFYADQPEDRKNNLLHLLQRHGVRTRWLSFHANGVPEGNQISNYSGLRSAYLCEHLAWLPAVLGLDYHVFLLSRGGRGLPPSDRQEAVYSMLKSVFTTKSLLGDFLADEIEQIQDSAHRSFVVFHIDFWLDQPSFLEQWDKEGRFATVAADRQAAVRMGAGRRSYELQAADVGKRLQALVSLLAGRGLLNDTMLVITGDHGVLLQEERYGYQVHPDEEVTRVPFLVIQRGKRGVDERLAETIDITKTVLEYFDVPDSLSPRAASIFAPSSGKDLAASATYFQNENKRWHVMLYQADKKYRFNIHRDGDAEALLMKLDGFEETTLDSGASVRRSIAAELVEILEEYGLDDGSVHPVFSRSALLAAKRGTSDD